VGAGESLAVNPLGAASEHATTALDVRQRLRAVAAVDINRHLHPQEEQLLSEIVHASWAARRAETRSSRRRLRLANVAKGAMSPDSWV
jgi:hypothetical protein